MLVCDCKDGESARVSSTYTLMELNEVLTRNEVQPTLKDSERLPSYTCKY